MTAQPARYTNDHHRLLRRFWKNTAYLEEQKLRRIQRRRQAILTVQAAQKVTGAAKWGMPSKLMDGAA